MEHQKNKIDNFEIAKPKNRGKSLTAISAGVAAAIISAVPENTNAQPIPVGEFGPEISEMMLEECGFDPPVGAAPISIGQGVKAERARLVFSGVADDCSIVPAAEELEVSDGLNNEIVIRSLGKPIAMPDQQCGFIEVDRGDGRDAKIRDCGDGTIYKDGELKWEYGKGDFLSEVYSIHSTADDPQKRRKRAERQTSGRPDAQCCRGWINGYEGHEPSHGRHQNFERWNCQDYQDD